MRDFIRTMTQQFKERNSKPEQYPPSLQAIEELRTRLIGRIPLKTLAKALGGMSVKVSTDSLSIALEEGLIDELATSLLTVYDYSMNVFGCPDFFVETCRKSSFELA